MSDHVLPTLISDAFTVVRALGERYVWLDPCYIIQDHEEDKLKDLSQMESMYRLAVVIIIATSGISAEASLPGARPCPRRTTQIPFKANGVQIVKTLEPNGNGDRGSYVSEII